MGEKKNKKRVDRMNKALISLVFLEVVVFLFLLFSTLLPYSNLVLAGVSQDNVTVATTLTVGNVYPEILNTSINDGADSIALSPNATVTIDIRAIARDYNNETDIINASVEFFDTVASAYGSADDNNNHYTNGSCFLDTSYGDAYEIAVNCTIAVEYYSNNQSWNATVEVVDNQSATDLGSDLITVNSLLAFALPDSINYGVVNATAVSDEQIANVTNAGNTLVNLSLSGYAVTVGDGFAMNCTLGATQNISIEHEKYNVSAANTGFFNLTELGGNYTNLSASVVTEQFNLAQRQNDSNRFIDDTNATYWRIYVPTGVAGTCSGNIVFGALQ